MGITFLFPSCESMLDGYVCFQMSARPFLAGNGVTLHISHMTLFGTNTLKDKWADMTEGNNYTIEDRYIFWNYPAVNLLIIDFNSSI